MNPAALVADHQGPLRSALRWAARHAIAAAMIPVGLALGAGGLVQEHLLRHRPPEPPDPDAGPPPGPGGGPP